MRRLVIVLALAAMLLGPVAGAFGGLSDEQFNNLKKRINAGIVKNPNGVKSDISDIAKDNSARAVKYLVAINRKALDNMDTVLVIQRALSSMGSDDARSAILANTPKAPDYRMRIILLEVCQRFAGSDVVTAMTACLSDRVEKVKITAARALGEKGSLDALDPLIKEMEKLAKKKQAGSRLYSDIRIALEKISGQRDLIEAQDWRNWYNANKDKIVPGAPGPEGRVGTAKPMVGEAKTVSFFGIQIDSRRIIFVIDVSGSMIIADPPPENWVPDKDLGKGKGTTVKEDDPTLKKKKEKERDRMKDRKVWEKERQRIVRTKKELIRVLKVLQGGRSPRVLRKPALPLNPRQSSGLRSFPRMASRSPMTRSGRLSKTGARTPTAREAATQGTGKARKLPPVLPAGLLQREGRRIRLSFFPTVHRRTWEAKGARSGAATRTPWL